MIRPSRRVFVTDEIDCAFPPASTLSVAPDLSSATLRGFGPFVSGLGTYTASAAAVHGQTTGTLTGNLTANFDTPGPLVLTAPPMEAVLRHPG